MPPAAATLIAEMARLQAAAHDHKRALYHHRRALVRTKEALARLEAECRARGIGFHRVPKEEGIHGHDSGSD